MSSVHQRDHVDILASRKGLPDDGAIFGPVVYLLHWRALYRLYSLAIHLAHNIC